jgi:hypothetical protein
MSGNGGMMVSMWGPPGWRFLHSVAHGYPESPSDFDEKNGIPLGTTELNYKNFFTLIGSTLPCGLCRESYVNFIAENPIRASSRADLTKWLWEIHNKVNQKLGREYAKSDFESVYQFYERYRAKCSPSSDAKGCTDPLYGKKSKHGMRLRLILVSIMVGVLILFKRYF